MLPLLLLLCLQPRPGVVRGTVVDAQTGEPLARVSVQLLASAYQATTDERGRFEFPEVQTGRYTLHVSTVGYRLVRRDFDVAAGEVKEFEVVLSPDMFRQTDSVEVRAGVFEPLRTETASELTLVGTEVKNLASVLADDPLRAVHALPGVTSDDDFNATFSLRGAEFDRIGLYLDDVLLHAPFHTVQERTASGTLTIFNGDMVQDMSLMSGAFPARYGDRTAGALDVRMREGSRRKASVRGTASASNAGIMSEGPINGGKGSWMASIRKSYLQYIIERTSPESDPTIAGGFWDAQGRASYDIAARHNVSFSAFEGKSGADRSRHKSNLGINTLMLSDFHFTLGSLAWRWTPRERLMLASRGAWMREKYWSENRDGLVLASGHYGEWVWSTNGNWMWGNERAVDAGVDLRRTKHSGFTNRYQFNPFAVLRLDDFSGNTGLTGTWAQQSWALLTGKVRLTAGGRWDRQDRTGLSAAAGRASAAFQPWASTRISLGWGQYTQFPDLQSLFSRIGGIGLRPERSIHAVASIEQRLSERSRLHAEVYQRLDRDLLYRPYENPRLIGGAVFNPPVDAPIQNSLRGYARGFEIFYQQRTANRFTGWISYALGYTRVRDGVTGDSFWADEDQRHTVNIYASYRVRPTVNLSTKWLYGSGLPVPGYLRRDRDQYYLAENRNEARLDPYHRADVRINKAFVFDRWKVTLYGEVVNLFNHTNRRYDAFNGYNSRTGQAYPGLSKMFPILPSAGVVLEF